MTAQEILYTCSLSEIVPLDPGLLDRGFMLGLDRDRLLKCFVTMISIMKPGSTIPSFNEREAMADAFGYLLADSLNVNKDDPVVCQGIDIYFCELTLAAGNARVKLPINLVDIQLIALRGERLTLNGTVVNGAQLLYRTTNSLHDRDDVDASTVWSSVPTGSL